MQDDVVNVTLAPGEFYFGGGHTRVQTLLGSCVAITVWHPVKRIGGMCHYLLSTRGTNQKAAKGYYADDAVEMFLKEIRRNNTKPFEYEVKLFGGANMFVCTSNNKGPTNVAANNILNGKILLQQSGFSKIKSKDVGGTSHRKIYLELWNGDVWVQRGRPVK